MFSTIIDQGNGIVWSALVYILLGVGIFFTLRLGFIQLRHFGHCFGVLKKSRQSDNAGISSFQALCTSLAARVGTGNLAGVAVAITLGGPGAVFWMWLIAMLGMATSFAESTLAQVYKTKDDDGNYRGGPAYYMEKGLGKRWMGSLFSVFLIIAFGLVFNAVQSNSIADAMHTAFGVNKPMMGGILVIATAVIIFGGIRSIARFAEVVVPFMALAYLALSMIVLLMNISELPNIITLIVKSAFGLQEAGAGAMGVAMMQGIKRGLFSNEAGMGSAPNAAASARPFPNHPASQGYVQMLGVFVDTIIICTCTAAVILLFPGYQPGAEGIEGISLTQQALSHHVGDWGANFIAITLLFFAFTSIVANYSYAETNIIFLEHNHKAGLMIFRLLVLGMVMFGSLASLPVVWAMADLSMGFMALINLVAIVMLSGVVVKLAKDYNLQLQQGKTPEFDPNHYPELKQQLEPGVWHDKK